MAEWDSVELAATPTLKQLAELGEEGIESVTEALKVIKIAGEASKIFLLSTVNPALLALIVIADAMIATLQNFKESGVFVIQVNPFDMPYGMKNEVPIGLEMEKDAGGLVNFLPSKITDPKNTDFGKIFTVNDEYRKSLNLRDLSTEYRDCNGEYKGSDIFVPPMPVLSKELKLVEGGYDPATWNGTKPPINQIKFGAEVGGFGGAISLPEFPADDCIELMAAAFEDEGDVSRFKIDPARTKPAYTYTGDKVTFTDATAPDYFDPTTLIGQALYESNDTDLSTSARKPITTLVSSGKPNYHGNTQLVGLKVSALAMVVASQNPQDWVKAISAILGLFGPGFEEFRKKMTDYANKLKEETRAKDTIRVRVDNRYGGGFFEVGDIIIGQKSNYIGKIVEIDKGTRSVMKTTEWSANVKAVSAPVPSAEPATEVYKRVIDLNVENRFEDTKIVVRDYNGMGVTRAFETGETILEGETYTYKNSEGDDETRYREKFLIKNKRAQRSGKVLADSEKPKRGIVLNQIPSIPASVTPDFNSLKLADMIPGYGPFFDDMINIAETIKAFAEGVLEAIQIIIEAIDDLVEYFEEIAENIIELIKLLTQGFPNAGIWIMGMTSQSGSDAFADALRSADNAPDETYKISAGFCFVGSPWLDPDPVKVLFGDILGVKYNAVDGSSAEETLALQEGVAAGLSGIEDASKAEAKLDEIDES